MAECGNFSLGSIDPNHREDLCSKRLNHSAEVAATIYQIANFDLPFANQQNAYQDPLLQIKFRSKNESDGG